MKNKKIALIMVTVLSVISLSACAKDSNKNQNSVSNTEQSRQVEQSQDKVDNTSKTDSSASKNDTQVDQNIQEDNKINTLSKIKGRKKEFLKRLDNIQKELDALPEKKDSDAGVTNAMKNFYGKSYDMYNKELNEIYALLKKELSPEIMENLQTEQIKWIKQKEDRAEKERLKYNDGTFENVAYMSSLYESTKKRCYELVNNYMTD